MVRLQPDPTSVVLAVLAAVLGAILSCEAGRGVHAGLPSNVNSYCEAASVVFARLLVAISSCEAGGGNWLSVALAGLLRAFFGSEEKEGIRIF